MAEPMTDEHGTTRGYNSHRRAGEQPCRDCISAHSAYGRAQRARRAAGIPIKKSTVEERFWAKIDAQGDCWEWAGYRNPDGYGRFNPSRRATVNAHRYAYELLVGPIPDGLVADHLCRNRGCVNPDHLELVTNRRNVLRGYGSSAMYARQMECVNGHAYSLANTYFTDAGSRVCRECKKLNQRRYVARKRAAA